MSSFSDISNNPSNWYIVTDQVMGGKSELEAGFDDGVFSLKGYVTTVNNGGFVRLAHRPDSVNKEVKGIRFMAKGNNETYEVHVTMQGLRMPPWAYHSSTFDVTSEWQMFEINFSDFEKKSGMSPINYSKSSEANKIFHQPVANDLMTKQDLSASIFGFKEYLI